jgi:hypothetical protein
LLGGSSLLAGCGSQLRASAAVTPARPRGPASKCRPFVHAAFVRRKEDYGMWWPGAVYDGKAARRKYTKELTQAVNEFGVQLNLRPDPIYSGEEADAWLAEAKATKVDGLMLLLLDRQQHTWPTVRKAADSGIPLVVFSPVGTSFTTNTIHLADKPGCVIYSTDDFSQAKYGLKMLVAGAKLHRARCVVLKGNKRSQSTMADLGITLQYVPAQTYLDDYHDTPVSDEVSAVADWYMFHARRRVGATRKDVLNGARGYFTARKIIEREAADAISMDCLGALRASKESLPCLAWSRLNDEGIPAACEADLGAVASHTLVQFLFDRPGFQQDPVADTSNGAIIGAHCSCPIRLNGFGRQPEPFVLMHHHALRDATARTIWRQGQRVTSVDVLPGNTKQGRKTKLLISAGTVLDNVSVPPSGGCVVSVRVKFDGDQPVLSFPGFHQLFFYGDYKQHLVEFCQLFNLEAQVV